MTAASARRRLLALRREDVRIQHLTRWRADRPPISDALMRLSLRVPWRRQWYPTVHPSEQCARCRPTGAAT
jgi:hypothetical protein